MGKKVRVEIEGLEPISVHASEKTELTGFIRLALIALLGGEYVNAEITVTEISYGNGIEKGHGEIPVIKTKVIYPPPKIPNR